MRLGLVAACAAVVLLSAGTSGGWAAGPTAVSGIITADTVWTLAGSPYVLTGDTIVERDVTLTIQPGVQVRADGPYQLEVVGSIRAIGTASQPVLFTRNREGQKWMGIYARARGSAEFRHVTVEYAETGIRLVRQTLHSPDTTASIEDSLFQYNDLGFSARTDTIQDPYVGGNTVRFNKQGAEARFLHNHRVERNEGHGIVGGHVFNSTVTNNGGDGVHSGQATNSVIANNGGNGIGRAAAITNSVIRDNRGYGAGVVFTTRMRGSSITGNGGFGIVALTAADYDARENWWGTTDRNAIAAMIYDFYDDRLLGKVAFEPFLTAPPVAGPGPGPTPTPTPSLPCNWSGRWQTASGGEQFAMTLIEEPGLPGQRAVRGSYGADNRKIEATATGDQLAGRWSGPPTYAEPLNAGRFRFTISADCRSFSGTWGFGPAETGGGVWTGARAPGDPAHAALVTAAYRAVVCRDPTLDELAYWVRSPISRAGLEALLRQGVEALQLLPVRQAYLELLGRDPLAGDCGGLRYWAGTGLPREAIEPYLAASDEGRRVRAIRDLYLELLGRDPLGPDTASLRGWVVSGLTLEQIRQAIMASDEYRQRTRAAG